MPELPDVELYRAALEPRIVGRRLGKRIVIAMETEVFLVIHLMIAGRFLKGDWPRTLEELEAVRDSRPSSPV